MGCPAPNALSRWSSGALPSAEADELGAHLATCEVCRRTVAAELGQSEDSPTESLVATVRARTAKPAPQKAPAPGPGSLVGRYVVVSELGRGGMGAVYAAYDPQLDRKVAIKVLLPVAQGLDSAEAALRLQREAQALARVAHPNTVAVYDVGTWEGRVFIAMEQVDGQTLRAWLREMPRRWDEVLRVLRQGGAGLEAVHSAGLVHRDFKPANVLVTRSAQVKVLDFGLARLSHNEGHRALAGVGPAVPSDASGGVSLDTPLTEEGSVSGTPGYLAPELLEGQPASPASDQFAFGVTLYQGLYGTRPFSGKAFKDVARAQLAGLPSPRPGPQASPGGCTPSCAAA